MSIIFGVHKFHQYLYGREFKLYTDHKPLTTNLGLRSGIPTLAAACMQRWALILSACTYQTVYRTSGKNVNADAMSRLPVSPAAYEEDIFQTTCLEELPVRAVILKMPPKLIRF